MVRHSWLYAVLSIRRLIVSLLFFFVFFSAPLKAIPENTMTRKAEIIKQLTSVVSWPSSVFSDTTLNICILGELADSKPLTDLNGQLANRRKLVVRNITAFSDAKKNCQLLYITETESKNTKQIIASFSGKPILLISDIANFARDGGSMNFMVLNEALAVSVNLIIIKKSKLNIDLKKYDEVTIIPETKDLND